MNEIRFGPGERPLDVDKHAKAILKDARMAMDQQQTFNWLVAEHTRLSAALDAQSKLLAEAREVIESAANGMPNAIALGRVLAKLKAASAIDY